MASKGKIVMDANSYENHLGPIIRDNNMEVVHVPPGDLNLTDTELVKKHAQGKWPVITADRSMYKQNPPDGSGATGFIVIKNNLAPEQLEDYKETFGEFIAPHTSKTLSGYVWELDIDGSCNQMKLNVK